jgi:clathrin heavy chain
VANTELLYRAIVFYVDNYPSLVVDLMLELCPKLDHSRVVNIMRSKKHLPLIVKYLKHVQLDNLPAVNEALNEHYLEEEDAAALRDSIEQYDAYDAITLAQRTETHELVEFRRIASHVYKLHGRYKKSIELSKADGVWGDAMETTFASGSAEFAEELLRFFVDEGDDGCYAGCLFVCYELLRPDLVLELAWRHNKMTQSMPYFINSFSEITDRVEKLEARFTRVDAEHDAEAAAEKAAEERQAKTDASFVGSNVGPYNPMMAPLALAAPPSFSQTQQFTAGGGAGQW